MLDARIQTLAGKCAHAAPGAARYIPDAYQTEDVEHLAETALALCQLPPPTVPPYAHPHINPTGIQA